jgi:IS5 family transposase
VLEIIGAPKGARTPVFAVKGGQAADVKVLPSLLQAVPAPRFVVADKAYDADALREYLIERGITPVIPNKDDRKFLHPFDPRRCKWRGTIERMFCRLKDFRRIATRYDKLARNYLASLCLAAIVTFWIR